MQTILPDWWVLNIFLSGSITVRGWLAWLATKEAKVLYDKFVKAGVWNPRDYKPPPWYFPEGIEMPDKLHNFTAGILRRGYSEEDIRKIIGLNLIRVFKDVWS